MSLAAAFALFVFLFSMRRNLCRFFEELSETEQKVKLGEKSKLRSLVKELKVKTVNMESKSPAADNESVALPNLGGFRLRGENLLATA